MPFWHGEFSTRSVDLSRRRRSAPARVWRRATAATIGAWRPRTGATRRASAILREYIAEQRAATGVVPDDRTIVIEQFPRRDWAQCGWCVHSIFGGRVNAPWGMALAQRMREALGDGVELQVQTSDDGIMLRLPDLAATRRRSTP